MEHLKKQRMVAATTISHRHKLGDSLGIQGICLAQGKYMKRMFRGSEENTMCRTSLWVTLDSNFFESYYQLRRPKLPIFHERSIKFHQGNRGGLQALA